MRGLNLLSLLFLVHCGKVATKTDVIKSSVVVGKNNFQCTFSLAVLPNKKVSLKKSKVLCSPRKPKRKKVSNVELIGDLGTFLVSLTINPSKIKSAVFVEAQECNCLTTQEYECPTQPECQCPASVAVNEFHSPTQNAIPATTPDSTQESTRPSLPESNFDEGLPPLYLGPGGSTVPQIFSLPVLGQGDERILDPIETACFIEESPHESNGGSVAFVHNGIFTECGGSLTTKEDFNPTEDTPYSRDCYSMINFEWIATTPMLTERYGATSVAMENGSVLVSGGQKDIFGLRLSTTEIYDGSTWTRGDDLPIAVNEHCMLVLPGGDLLMVGGWRSRGLGEGTFGETSSTYIYSNNSGVWMEKARMSIPRVHHACALYNGEAWVGGSGPKDLPFEPYNLVGSVEIYNPVNNTWREGPHLPYTAFHPGEFVNHGQALMYVGGFDADYGKQIHQLNNGQDGWNFIKNMTESRHDFPVLVISEAECNGVSYSSDGKTGIVSGSILDVLDNLTKTSLEVEVNCCSQGVVSATIMCGNGVSCEAICGEYNKEFAILSLTRDASEAEVCPLVYKRHFVITTTIYQLNYCPRRVRNAEQLNSYKQCCLHPAVYRKPKIKQKCCAYGLCV